MTATTTALADAEARDVSAAASGDHAAFARLVDLYRAALCSIAQAILRDPSASEDVAQDTFIAAWGQLSDLRNPHSFGPWLRQITRNRAHDRRRRLGRERPLPDDGSDRLIDPGPHPGDAAIADERRAIVDEAMEQLPQDGREILLLYYREGRSVRQVAHLIGLSEAAAKKRLTRARAKLRADVLERLADVAVATAPRAAFTAAVMAALTVGGPSVAAAATMSAAAGAGKLAKIGIGLGGAGLGATFGILGVVFGMKRHERQAGSDPERRRLRRITVVSVIHVGLCALAVLPIQAYGLPALTMWIWYLAFVGGLTLVHYVWIPRVIGPRLSAERAADPTAVRRQRRQWWWGFGGWLAGAVAGAAATAYAITMSSG